jgi:hypothetical protein
VILLLDACSITFEREKGTMPKRREGWWFIKKMAKWRVKMSSAKLKFLILTGGCSLMSIIVIISKPLPCCRKGAVVSVTTTFSRITCYSQKKKIYMFKKISHFLYIHYFKFKCLRRFIRKRIFFITKNYLGKKKMRKSVREKN